MQREIGNELKIEIGRAFAQKMAGSNSFNQSIDQVKFFDHFFWDNIAKKAAEIVDRL